MSGDIRIHTERKHGTLYKGIKNMLSMKCATSFFSVLALDT